MTTACLSLFLRAPRHGLVALFLFTLLTALPAVAEEHDEPSAGPPPRIQMPKGIERATENETGHGHIHRHHAGLFLGGSTITRCTGFTIGGDYVLRLSKYIGVGVQLEHAFGDMKETVAAFPLVFYPGAGLWLGTGPGFEKFTGKLPTVSHGHDELAHDKNLHFLWRFQVGYDFPIGRRFTFTPNVAVDFQSGRQVWVYGATFGLCF